MGWPLGGPGFASFLRGFSSCGFIRRCSKHTEACLLYPSGNRQQQKTPPPKSPHAPRAARLDPKTRTASHGHPLMDAPATSFVPMEGSREPPPPLPTREKASHLLAEVESDTALATKAGA